MVVFATFSNAIEIHNNYINMFFFDFFGEL